MPDNNHSIFISRLLIFIVWSMVSRGVESLPQNYEDIDMSVDQAKNEKVDIRWIRSDIVRYWKS